MARTTGQLAHDRTVHDALAGARASSFWLDDAASLAPELPDRLAGSDRADLVVVGAGFSGLWTALLAKEADPGRDVLVVDARTVGWAASGRNGGFCEASLTHGLANGRDRFPSEIDRLEELGEENLQGLLATCERYGIDADIEAAGMFAVATAAWQAAALGESYHHARELGHDVEYWDGERIRAEVHSPTFQGALVERSGVVMLHPAKLAFGLARACQELGVRFAEHTPVRELTGRPTGVDVVTDSGLIRADAVAVATNAFPSPVRRVRNYVLPVWDYVLVTEPLTDEQRASIGWSGREGMADAGNQFHYFRLTADNRILWGGYDAIYNYGNAISDDLISRPASHQLLARQFLDTFPTLAGIRFSHAWGGAIDTCSRFCAFFGTAQRGRVAYAAGYTGLGVGATRFGAQVMLDLLAGGSELTELDMVRTKPVPFPPEPLRSAVVQATRWSIAAADRNDGRRNLWLRTLDRFGLGFDS